MQLYRWRARSMAGKLYQGSYLADSKQEVAASAPQVVEDSTWE